MKKIIGIVMLSLLLGFVSCKKSSEEDAEYVTEQKDRNEKEIQKYIVDNNLQMQKTKTGLYYSLQGTDNGIKPDTSRNFVYLKYKITAIPSGTILDTNYVQTSNKVLIAPINSGSGKIPVVGLIEGLALMSEGQKGVFLMNNQLAYSAGVSGNSFIPSYSAVRVDVELINVKTDYEFLTGYIQQKGYTITGGANDTRVAITYSNPTGQQVKDTSSTVYINYVGRLALTGEIFESKQNVAFNLNSGLIPGFKNGLVQFKAEESGVIFIPYRKGYGITGSGAIPGFSPLIFEVTVIRL
jgi:FKBP-type peptidyl-prolyl cis-trans isomerase